MTDTHERILSSSEEELQLTMKERISSEIDLVSSDLALTAGHYALNLAFAILAAAAAANGMNGMIGIFAFLLYNFAHYAMVGYFARHKTQQYLLTELRLRYDYRYASAAGGRFSFLFGLLLLVMLHPSFTGLPVIHQIPLRLLPVIFAAAAIFVRICTYYLLKARIRRQFT